MSKIISNPDKEQATLGTDTIAEFNNPAMDETVNTAVQVLATQRSPEWLKYYGSEVKTTKYDKAFSTGINENLDTDTASEIFSYIATNATTDEKKSSIVSGVNDGVCIVEYPPKDLSFGCIFYRPEFFGLQSSRSYNKRFSLKRLLKLYSLGSIRDFTVVESVDPVVDEESVIVVDAA
jgi:hypothetical protein